MKLMRMNYIVIMPAFFLLLLSACKPTCQKHPDDVECVGEEEVITTLKLTFKDSATGVVAYTYQFKDSDNNGVPEIFDTLKLLANKAYKTEVRFLNEASLPVQDMTEEIEREKNDHLLIFHVFSVAINFTYIDFDDHGLPVGLQTYWRTNITGNGNVQIILRHQPAVKDGTETPGDTDMEVDFPLVVQ